MWIIYLIYLSSITVGKINVNTHAWFDVLQPKWKIRNKFEYIGPISSGNTLNRVKIG